jgi:hypothetical protein
LLEQELIKMSSTLSKICTRETTLVAADRRLSVKGGTGTAEGARGQSVAATYSLLSAFYSNLTKDG